MIYRLFTERLPYADTKWLWLAALVFTAALSALALRVFKNKLPRDKGREFAVDGALSAGKVRGAGIVFVCCFIISALLFVPVTLEYVFYYILVFFGMLSGYLDDRSDKPWGEYKKGVIDLIISTLTALCFVHYNPELLNLSFFGFGFHVHPVIYVILGALAVWMLVNAVNCSDGIDGYSSSLTIVSLLSASGAILINGTGKAPLIAALLMIVSLLPYLWKNAQPSTMLMGDAGSRALGLFLCITMFKTGNALLIIPMCCMLCLDGLVGIVKIVTIRFLHINPLKNIRTPLHDHFRKNKGWSNSQVIFRLCILQSLISAAALIIMK